MEVLDTGTIQVLPDTLANKIAAGEVVQRPASAVKELMENAIDAGASHIQVLIKKAGRELIQVIDDGCGMGPTDARTCFGRHATSKIRSAEDLERIHTLGFRGEALASISAVAQVELRTKRVTDDAGINIRIDGGKLIHEEPCATPNGTSIAVRNLFFNVPARRNFLKSPATEFKHIVETFQFLALSNPDVGFTLSHDEKTVYTLTAPPEETPFIEALEVRIQALFGKRQIGTLVRVSEDTSYLSVDGFVGRPEFSRRSRDEQFFFVNGRYVKSRALEHAVANGYGEMLPKGAYPFFTIFLRLDPKHVDVNVHPTKAEIKFDDERGIYGFIRAVVKKGLGEADITPQMGFTDQGKLKERYGAAPPSPQMDFDAVLRQATPPQRTVGSFPSAPTSQREHQTSTHRAPTAHPRPQDPDRFQRNLGDLSAALYAPEDGEQQEIQVSSKADGDQELVLPAMHAEFSGADSSDERLLWQLHEKYVLTRIRSGLMIMDQHAAHERILYEKFRKMMEGGLGASQQLLFPYTMEFEAADFELLQELLPDVRSLGFDLEILSGRSAMIRGVPTDVQSGQERSILKELMEQYRAYESELQIKGRDNLAKSLSCRSAIKTGKRLSLTEMKVLIDQLFDCEMPYACPHGRPTMIKISIEELDKRFGRVGHLER